MCIGTSPTNQEVQGFSVTVKGVRDAAGRTRDWVSASVVHKQLRESREADRETWAVRPHPRVPALTLHPTPGNNAP